MTHFFRLGLFLTKLFPYKDDGSNRIGEEPGFLTVGFKSSTLMNYL
jgi:hypothetical protein